MPDFPLNVIVEIELSAISPQKPKDISDEEWKKLRLAFCNTPEEIVLRNHKKSVIYLREDSGIYSERDKITRMVKYRRVQ